MSPEYVLPMSSENPVTYVPGWFEFLASERTSTRASDEAMKPYGMRLTVGSIVRNSSVVSARMSSFAAH